NNISFANAVANVVFKDCKAISFGSSFVEPESVASSTPTVPVPAAISAAEAVFKARSQPCWNILCNLTTLSPWSMSFKFRTKQTLSGLLFSSLR
ncbi:hypothetical protein DFH06DRAFT_1014827, partial [Mycena polygramma]